MWKTEYIFSVPHLDAVCIRLHKLKFNYPNFCCVVHSYSILWICVRLYAVLRSNEFNTKERMSECVFGECQTKSHNKNQSKYNFSIHNSIFVDLKCSHTQRVDTQRTYIFHTFKRNEHRVCYEFRRWISQICSVWMARYIIRNGALHMDSELSVPSFLFDVFVHFFSCKFHK